MRAPRKAPRIQSVKIRRAQSLASSAKVNFAHAEVTKHVKPEESMYQAATIVNVLSPVITSVVGVEEFHCSEDSMQAFVFGENAEPYRGRRQWHGTRWILGELGRSNDFFPETASMRRQALKGKELQMNRWKSDSLIVLGVRERRIHGEAVSNENAQVDAWSSNTQRLIT